jgi:hypothetical protein
VARFSDFAKMIKVSYITGRSLSKVVGAADREQSLVHHYLILPGLFMTGLRSKETMKPTNK